ncbi:hypothetical protein KIN20_023849 [Parelaphostrongylus tenuis]|uniref:Uncharacterized protein n=1 Tax=Parelaphostrongylus tenuis TaxID=148309 RepID=A0AAD5NAG2_PARTN|nr:hypothetical protein KIN20_023849 [Parelaphostrongylus tenuis]
MPATPTLRPSCTSDAREVNRENAIEVIDEGPTLAIGELADDFDYNHVITSTILKQNNG